MSNKSPIFPMPEPQHFSDYGFDPQIDYFQFLEEARKHKRSETATARSSVDSLHFKLEKPISKEESANRKIRKGNKKKKKKKKKWWRNALLFFKWKWVRNNHKDGCLDDHEDVHKARARAFRATISGPVYSTDSLSGSGTPYRSTSRPSSGPLAGTLTPARKGDLETPYLSLRDLNMEEQQQQQRIFTSALPIYLVT